MFLNCASILLDSKFFLYAAASLGSSPFHFHSTSTPGHLNFHLILLFYCLWFVVLFYWFHFSIETHRKTIAWSIVREFSSALAFEQFWRLLSSLTLALTLTLSRFLAFALLLSHLAVVCSPIAIPFLCIFRAWCGQLYPEFLCFLIMDRFFLTLFPLSQWHIYLPLPSSLKGAYCEFYPFFF